MKTKTIFKTLALAMLMPTMLLTIACSTEDDIVNNPTGTEAVDKKGYELPVTVNVTRQGNEATTRATYNESTRKLGFSTGDKLFVDGELLKDGGGKYAGILNYVSDGTFSGTIYTQKEFHGTADDLFQSSYTVVGGTLLPAGYEDYGFLTISGEGYNASVVVNKTYKFAPSKAAGVEQFSYETGAYLHDARTFSLSPQAAILNFTISGLARDADVTLTGAGCNITGTVTPDDTGKATFAAGLYYRLQLRDYTLTVDGDAYPLVSDTRGIVEGKIYSFSRYCPLPGLFSVAPGKTVRFSPGNLQFQASTKTWRFAEHQYDYVGDATNGNVYVGETKCDNGQISETYSGWIDLFGWGTSGHLFPKGEDANAFNSYGSQYQPWSTDGNTSNYGPGDPNNDLVGAWANGDWGVKNMSAGWRTLTMDEWMYLTGDPNESSYDKRSASTVNGVENARFAKAYLFGTTHGLILFPDSYTHPDGVAQPTGINNSWSDSWNANQYSVSDWRKMEAAGCVFLPAAGYRASLNVSGLGDCGMYWSTTAGFEYRLTGYCLRFNNNNLNPHEGLRRYPGRSVRLIYDR